MTTDLSESYTLIQDLHSRFDYIHHIAESMAQRAEAMKSGGDSLTAEELLDYAMKIMKGAH